MTIQNIFNEIKSVKASLSAQLAEIDADAIHSGEYKLAKREEAKTAARERLGEINAGADEAIRSLLAKTQERAAFDYSNPRLLGAVQFIQANGAALPESAWRQMIRDFDGRPSELSYLSQLFEKSGAIDAAIEAQEAAKRESMTVSLPQRISDAIFYATSADPTAHVDFSGYEAELARIEADDQSSGE